MNYLLVLIILGLGWGGYYEYNHLQQQNARDKQEFQATTDARMTQLEDENTKLQVDNADLNQKLAAAQAKMATMTAQSAAAPAPAPVALQSQPVHPPEPPKPPPLPSNDLGSITTTGGKEFGKCHLLKIDATGITLSCVSGITKINFDSLPAALQQRFGFDPRQGDRLPLPQVQTLEEQRALAERQTTTGP